LHALRTIPDTALPRIAPAGAATRKNSAQLSLLGRRRKYETIASPTSAGSGSRSRRAPLAVADRPDRPRVPDRARYAHPRATRQPDSRAVFAMTSGVSVVTALAPTASTMPETSLHDTKRGPDAESRQWLDALSDAGPKHQDAVDRLHALLRRAARFEIKRRRPELADTRPGELEDLATQAAADALMAIMGKLRTYRGEVASPPGPTFALLEAAVKVRGRAWQEREIPLEDDGWAQLADSRAVPETGAETAELIDALRYAIIEALTPHQRAVLIAITLNDVLIDVLAERLTTTRGALYKTLHDPRTKLRTQLASDGHALDYLQQGGAP
jgi:RNA polymerase sigma-70 factor (ECF subfamily)